MHTFIIISIQYEIKINRSAYGSPVASGLFPTKTSYSALATDCEGTVVRGDHNELQAEPFINNLPASFARMEFLTVRLNIAWLFVFHFDQRVQRLAPTSLQIRARTGCNLVKMAESCFESRFSPSHISSLIQEFLPRDYIFLHE